MKIKTLGIALIISIIAFNSHASQNIDLQFAPEAGTQANFDNGSISFSNPNGADFKIVSSDAYYDSIGDTITVGGSFNIGTIVNYTQSTGIPFQTAPLIGNPGNTISINDGTGNSLQGIIQWFLVSSLYNDQHVFFLDGEIYRNPKTYTGTQKDLLSLVSPDLSGINFDIQLNDISNLYDLTGIDTVTSMHGILNAGPIPNVPHNTPDSSLSLLLLLLSLTFLSAYKFQSVFIESK